MWRHLSPAERYLGSVCLCIFCPHALYFSASHLQESKPRASFSPPNRELLVKLHSSLRLAPLSRHIRVSASLSVLPI
jgi:hypothetical protein